MTALLIKEAVNQTVDLMGFTNALNAAFTLHQINHAHWMILNPDGAPVGTPALGVPSLARRPTGRPRRARRAGRRVRGPLRPTADDRPEGTRPLHGGASLQRLLRPTSVAVVGATDSSTLSQTVASIFERDDRRLRREPEARRPSSARRPTRA